MLCWARSSGRASQTPSWGPVARGTGASNRDVSSKEVGLNIRDWFGGVKGKSKATVCVGNAYTTERWWVELASEALNTNYGGSANCLITTALWGWKHHHHFTYEETGLE